MSRHRNFSLSYTFIIKIIMIKRHFSSQLWRVLLQLMKEMQSAPTEIDLMKDTIAVLTNGSTPLEEVLLALEVLQSLVEPIDNANGQ